jgi:AcrR family transcriptional regulator
VTSSAGETGTRRLSGGERREAILAAALEVFAASGYHGSSIDDIARRAGVSKALIYEHFPSKKELHVSLLDTHVGVLFERLAASAATGEPGDVRLRAGVDAFLEFVEERREAWRMLFRDAADPDVAETLDRVQAQATAAIAGLIATEPVDAEAGPPRDPERVIEMLAQLLSGAVQALANWWNTHQDVPREELVETVMDFAWLGFERLRAGERWQGRRLRPATTPPGAAARAR